MRIGIAGAGAMGSRFGYMLSEAGYDVTLIDPWEAHVTAIRENGLIIDWNGEERVAHLPIVFPAEADGVFDLIICFTKAMGLDSMLSAIRSTIGEHTSILCLLNGIGHEETVRKYVPDDNFIIGNTMWTAGLDGPGRAHLHGEGSLSLENVSASEEARERAQEVVQILDSAGLNAIYSEDVKHSIYRKATLNGVLNSLCTLLECRMYDFGCTRLPDTVMRNIVDEFADVAAHEGVTLDRDEAMEYIRATLPLESLGEHFPSMYQDLIKNNRLTEIDYINGAIVTKGEKYGIPTPYCRLITELVHAKEHLRNAQ